MKSRLLIFLLLFSQMVFSQNHEKKEYTCPMHPEIIRSEPGKCPICGMDLVLVKNVEQDETTEHSNESLTRNSNNGKVSFEGKTVRYDLYVKDTLVNFTGKNRRAIATNGKLQAPTLYFKEGDTAEIYLHNQLKENTALHWHGVVLPNEMDGVPYLTTKPTKPGETHLYKFVVSQNGTYWYHSHNGLQEQIGMNGVLVFGKRDEPHQTYKADIPVLLGEWSDENPHTIMRRLHMDNTGWYAIKKDYAQSYGEALATGNFWTKLKNEWLRMEAMDVSDVYYDKFLINGTPTSQYSQLKAGDKVRLRIVNGASSTYFWINFGGGKFKVIGSDGNDIEPLEVDRLIIGNSEIYDIEITIPSNKQFELRATSEDRVGYTSLWLGEGEKIAAATLPKLDIFEGMKMMNGMMKMNGNMKPMNMKMGNQMMDMNEVMYPELPKSQRENTMKHMMQMMGSTKSSTEHQQEKTHQKAESTEMEMQNTSDKSHSMNDAHKMDMNEINKSEKEIKRLTYSEMSAQEKTVLPDENVKELQFQLEGNMRNYLWTLDNKTVLETDKILIKKGEVLRITLYNNSMMRHPMHLHGHDFRIVNANGDYSPLKNVLDIMPMETNTIEFAANQDGDWFFHCHILYHMMAGMGRIFSYEDSNPNPQLPNKAEANRKFRKENFMVHSYAMADIASNQLSAQTMTMFGARWMNTNEFDSDWKFNHYDADFKVGRFIGKFGWFFPYAGFRISGDQSHKTDLNFDKNWFGQEIPTGNQYTVTAGFKYILPWLVVADASIDHKGNILLELERENIPLTKRIRGNFSVNSNKEFTGGLRYILNQTFSISGNYNTENGFGAGLTLVY